MVGGKPPFAKTGERSYFKVGYRVSACKVVTGEGEWRWLVKWIDGMYNAKHQILTDAEFAESVSLNQGDEGKPKTQSRRRPKK